MAETVEKHWIETTELPKDILENLVEAFKKWNKKNYPELSECEVIDSLLENNLDDVLKAEVIVAKKIKDLICKK
jgi:arsenate reductase-like glutaredoxin family protein